MVIFASNLTLTYGFCEGTVYDRTFSNSLPEIPSIHRRVLDNPRY